MLVLRRKIGERLILGEVVSIEILAVQGDRVKLGINAPSDVTVVREELLYQEEERKSLEGDVPASTGKGA